MSANFTVFRLTEDLCQPVYRNDFGSNQFPQYTSCADRLKLIYISNHNNMIVIGRKT